MSLAESWAEEASTAYMFGVDSFYDGACARDYDPWVHAEMLGARVVANRTLPDPMVAAYDPDRHAIFLRPNLPAVVERCGLAHELVHFEHRDVGETKAQEERAERISTLRLIRPRRVEEAAQWGGGLGQIAIELGVTEKVMRRYARMVRNGTLPKWY